MPVTLSFPMPAVSFALFSFPTLALFFAVISVAVSVSVKEVFVSEMCPLADFLRLDGLNVQIIDSRRLGRARLPAEKQDACRCGD